MSTVLVILSLKSPMNSLLKKLFPLQVFKKLHLGTVSFGTESFPEVKEHLVNEYNNGTKQGTKVKTETSVVLYTCIIGQEC